MMQRPKQTLLTSQQWLFMIVAAAAIFLVMVGLRPDIVPSWIGFALIGILGAVAIWRTPQASAEVTATTIIAQPDTKSAHAVQVSPETAVMLRQTLNQQELNIQEQVALAEQTNTLLGKYMATGEQVQTQTRTMNQTTREATNNV